MTTIEKIDEQDLEVEWDLTILENSINQAIETLDYDQALLLIKKGLKLSKNTQSKKWIAVFQNLVSEVEILISDLDNKSLINESESEKIYNGEQEGVIKEINQEIISSQEPFLVSVKKGNAAISQITGIGTKTANLLKENGINTVKELASKKIEHLCSIRGIAVKSAEKYIKEAKNYMKQESLSNYMPTQSQVINEDTNTREKKEDLNENIEADEFEINDRYNAFETPEDPMMDGIEIVESIDSIESKSEETVLPEFRIGDLSEGDIRETKFNNRQESSLNNLDSFSRVASKDSEYEGEQLNWKLTTEAIKRIEKKLQSCGFSLIPAKKIKYKEFFDIVDVICIKSVKLSDLMDLALIIPIKLSKALGDLKVGEDEISYLPRQEKFPLPSYKERLLVESGAKALKLISKNLIFSINEEGTIHSYLTKYFQEELSSQKPISSNVMILRSNKSVIKVVMCPILVTIGEVKFLEASTVSFAYQKKNNIYVVQESRLADLLDYLEEKILITNSLDKNESFIDEYIDNCDKTLKRATIFSVPFSLFGMGLLSFTVINRSIPSSILFMGVGMMILMITGLGYISYSYIQNRRKLMEHQNDGNNAHTLNIDDSDLILIADRLKGNLLGQFAYEYGLNADNFELLSEEEIKNSLKACEAKAERREFLSYKNELMSDLDDDLIRKYGKFLED